MKRQVCFRKPFKELNREDSVDKISIIQYTNTDSDGH